VFCFPGVVCSAILQDGTKDTIARCNHWVALLGFAPNLFVLLSGRRPQRLAGKQFMPGFEEERAINGSHSIRCVKASPSEPPLRKFTFCGAHSVNSEAATSAIQHSGQQRFFDE
jgi:hypothetical protein